MSASRLLVTLATCALLIACSSGDKPPESAFKAQTDTMHKAAEVNQMVEDQDAAARKAIDAQSQ